MAFEVKFYSFAKKLNSTKRPTGTARTYQCEIKTDCDIINPTIILSGTNTEVESNYNYCYIAIWNRYYFVTKYIFKDGLWYIKLSVDVLATWKTYIGDSTLYIERASSGGDGSIVDDLVIGKGLATLNNYATYPIFDSDILGMQSGTYIIGVKGADPSNSINTPVITYYALTPAAMKSFITNLTDSNQTWYSDISKEILKANLDPFQFLVSCNWFPFNFYTPLTSITQIELGWFTIPLTGNACVAGNQQLIRILKKPIPKHPQYTSNTTRYLNNSKFHSVYISLPGVGLQKLDGDVLSAASTMSIFLFIDMYTGDGLYTISIDNSNAELYKIPASIGVSIPLSATYAASSQRGGGLISNAINNVSQIIFPIASARLALAMSEQARDNKVMSGIGRFSALAAITANPNTLSSNFSGTMGSTALLSTSISIYSLDIPVQLPDYTDVGYPVYKRNKISNYSGYVKVIDAHCEAPATDGELDEINAYLNGGFFYE